jgi:hypothetical protein
MWIASKLGFFSIVVKDGFFNIRARKRADLEALVLETPKIAQYEIETWSAADYRYRIRIPDDDKNFKNVAEIFATFVDTIDYGNFKNEIAATPSQRDKLHAYHEIWGIMAALQS